MPGRKGSKAAAEKAENQAKQNVETVDESDDESKAPIEAKVAGEKADGVETTEPSTKKSGRGRPKKIEGEQPVAKKPKTTRVMTKPSRVSQRVSNQKKGVKMPNEDGIKKAGKKAPKAKSSKKTENPSKDISEPVEEDEEDEEDAATSNGAAEQTVES